VLDVKILLESLLIVAVPIRPTTAALCLSAVDPSHLEPERIEDLPIVAENAADVARLCNIKQSLS